MPVRMEDVEVTEGDVTASMRNINLMRVDKFIRTASEQEARKIRGWSEHRLMSLGAIQPERKIRKRDRVLSRLAVEAVPILLTLLVVIPLVIWGVVALGINTSLIIYAYSCPPTCSKETLIIWSVVSGLGFLAIILAYYSIRKLMIRARK